MKNERLEIISWGEFQEGIADLWKSENPKSIPIFNNPYNIIQYDKSVWQEKIVYFPAKYLCDDVTVGYISIYNLSDIHIRPRGIYILPEYRGKGLGHRMQQAAWNFFPKTFYRAFIWSRDYNVERFMKHSGMKVVPGGTNIWSEYSNLSMSLLCGERGTKPTLVEIVKNQQFIQHHHEKFSYGGKNNLNAAYSEVDWNNYFDTHRGNYIDLKINLDFV